MPPPNSGHIVLQCWPEHRAAPPRRIFLDRKHAGRQGAQSGPAQASPANVGSSCAEKGVREQTARAEQRTEGKSSWSADSFDVCAALLWRRARGNVRSRLAHRRGAYIDRLQDRRRRIPDDAWALYALHGPHLPRFRASSKELHELHRRFRLGRARFFILQRFREERRVTRRREISNSQL